MRLTRGVILQANLTASLAAALAAITTLILSTMPNSLPTWRIWSIKAEIDRNTSFLGCGGIAGGSTSEGILTDCVSRGDIYVINTYDDVSLQVEVAGLTNCRHIGGVTNCVNYTNIHLRSTTYEDNRNDQPKNYYYQICAFTLCSGSGEPFKNCVNFGLLL